MRNAPGEYQLPFVLSSVSRVFQGKGVANLSFFLLPLGQEWMFWDFIDMLNVGSNKKYFVALMSET